jgi:hypothetical protein
MHTAVAGHKDVNSAVCSTPDGTTSREHAENPMRSKKPAAEVVRRNSRVRPAFLEYATT